MDQKEEEDKKSGRRTASTRHHRQSMGEIGPHIISKKGTLGGDARGTRQFINGILWILRTGGHGGICRKRMGTGRMYTAVSAGGVTRVAGNGFWKPWWTTQTLRG